MSTPIPKAPRRGTKSAKIWHRYYAAKAAWHEESARIISETMPDSFAVRDQRKEAARFREGADQIANKTHPNLRDGTWK